MNTPLLQNILDQPAALRAAAQHHTSTGGREALENAARILSSKRRLVVSGMGASYFAAIPFAYLLENSGLFPHLIESAELLHAPEPPVDSDTAVVLVSRSGESVEVIKLLPELRRRGAAVIGVTNIPRSALATGADQALLTNSPPDQLVAIQSYVATLTAFVFLAATIDAGLAGCTPELQQAVTLLDTWIPRCVARRQEMGPFLSEAAPLYLLGRGAALGTVAEGALLMHETAKAAAVGMSSAQFRHGPVEVVDQSFRAVVIGTQPETAALDAALAQDLSTMGGQVRWIGPPGSVASALPLLEWPGDVPPRFSSVIEIVPLQIAAYLRAEQRGIRPGDFRWAAPITTSETGFTLPVGH